jgi:peptidoglycan/xylan/chitin deacetylase (PgdA/CDA1 family)
VAGTLPGAATPPSAAAAATAAAACPTPRTAPVSSAPGAGKTVALTFDDGPSEYTGYVLQALARAKVKATFFVVGAKIGPRADLVRQATRAGHLVANHSWDHTYPTKVPGGWSDAYLRRSMADTNAAVTAAGGRRPCWFRPPGGFMPPTVLPAARAERMSVALWSVDTRDWQVQASGGRTLDERQRMVNTIVARALDGRSKQHPVVLLHDGGGFRGATSTAVARIVAGYKAKGYRFVTLDGRS